MSEKDLGDDITRGAVTTNDGVTLRYLEAGSGSPLLMIPGWSQTAEQFKHQLAGLRAHHRVIALDMRGHGESDKADHGYKISRLAKDVHDVIHALELQEVNLLGHSMGCSVIWSYWELFGAERLKRLLLIDQMPAVTRNPLWSDEEAADYGCIFTPESLYETVNGLAGPAGVETTKGFIGGMVTEAMSQAERDWMIDCNLRLPRPLAAALLLNHAGQDWRDTIARIALPTLVVAGRASLVPWTACAWIAGQIAGSRLEIFEEAEGGQHFMFIENHKKFNAILADFLN
ncbi:MAG: alpha/beta hydrolase [Rhodospirillales bacterium]